MTGLRIFCLVLALLTLRCSVESITVPYIPTMLLGRTFDYSKSAVGMDIYDASVRDHPVVRHHNKAYMKSKIIKTTEDVRDVLDVSGQLSLKVMAGAISIEGKGSYLKSSIESGNTIEVLTQIYYRTVTKTITDDKTPIRNWDSRPVIGKHYIRSVTYGGYLIVSLKFTAKKTSTKEEIKAKLSAGINAGVSLNVKGQFDKLTKAAGESASIAVHYTSSTIPDLAPIDLDSIMEIIDNFPEKVKSEQDGIGVPIEVELKKLSFLPEGKKYKFVDSSEIGPNIDRLGKMYHDIMITLNGIRKSLKDAPLAEDQEDIYGTFYDKIIQMHETFLNAIENLDLNGLTADKKQFNGIFNAYAENKKHFLFGRFWRQWQHIKKQNPWDPEEIRTSNEEKEENGKRKQEMTKNVAELDEEISPFENLLLDKEVAIWFPQQSVHNYMIDKGAPEMESIMACFSAKLINAGRFLDIISYSSSTSNFKWRVSYHGKYLHLVTSDKNSPLNKHWSGPTGELDGQWHTLCVSWDVNVKVRMFKDGRKILSKAFSKMPKIPGGGTWVIGQEQGDVGREFDKSGSFTGEIRNVNIYANFDKKLFRRIGGGITSNTCQRKYSKYILKSWEDLKIGLIGNYKTMVKNSPCLN